MNLDDYLKQNKIPPPEFSKKLGLKGKATIYRYMAGKHIPRPQVMDKITLATNGEVTANDFYTTQ